MAAANSGAGSPDPSPNYLQGSACQGLLMEAEKEFLEGSPGASSSFPDPFGDFSAFPKGWENKAWDPLGDVRNNFASLGIN